MAEENGAPSKSSTGQLWKVDEWRLETEVPNLKKMWIFLTNVDQENVEKFDNNFWALWLKLTIFQEPKANNANSKSDVNLSRRKHPSLSPEPEIVLMNRTAVNPFHLNWRNS